MSESKNIDLTDNVSVVEDGFEQYQAKSSYESDGFITLSDIDEKPQSKPNLKVCLDDMEDDICIVSEPDPQQDEDIVPRSGLETNNKLLNSVNISTNCDREPTSIIGSSIQAGQGISEILDKTPQLTPKKRGRRKKNTYLSVDVKEQCNTSNQNVTSDYIDQSSLLEEGNADSNCITASDKTVFDRLKPSPSCESVSTFTQTVKRKKKRLRKDIAIKPQANLIGVGYSLKPRKRGRPKKVINLITDQQESQSGQNVYIPPKINTGTYQEKSLIEGDQINKRLNSDKDVPQCNKTPITVTEKKLNETTPRRRGRPKKQILDNNVTNLVESIEVTNTSCVPILKQSSLVSSSKPEKTESKNMEDDKKYDEVELELLRMLSTPTKELEEKCNKKETKTKQKLPKKRGRKPKKLTEKVRNEFETSQNNEAEQADKDEEVDDETDDVCLSSLKKRLRPEDDNKTEDTMEVNVNVATTDSVNEISNNITGILTKRNAKKPIMSDFEYNVDTIMSESVAGDLAEECVAEMNNPEIESPSKRPTRKKAKKVLHYDEGSDEDPFANVELSDDGSDGRRGGRYYSDDEYIPGKRKKGKGYSESESSVSESDELENKEETVAKKLGRKKGRISEELPKKANKRSKKNDLTQSPLLDVTSTAADTTTEIDDDLEYSLQSSDITTNENSNQKPSQVWGMSHDFEKLLAQKIQGTNLKIKKLTGTTSNESALTPLEIPVLDPNQPKKSVENSTQTNKSSSKTVEVQTTSPYESIMKTKVSLTAEQSEKACEFLKGIVKNTSELGQLMIQKSEDFIKKKINTKNVTDTNKMDYCVQKSFLLFKLAKHNLIQMEEDLANEYEQFLRTNNMLQYRESPKCITATSKQTNIDSDSDCEIVEEPVPNQQKEKEKSKFNLKTVFLNKELSIKIAKKSNEETQPKKEKVNIQGRHAVWINDSIMVKKVKPTQSFLAQDSRNKKPPDTYVSIEMVREFFDNYYKRQQVLLTCAPFISPEWLNVKQISVCSYFIAQSNDFSTHSHILLTPQNGSESNNDGINGDMKENDFAQPISLLALCTKAVHKYMYEKGPNYKQSFLVEKKCDLPLEQDYQPCTLFRISFNLISSLLVIKDNHQLMEKYKSRKIYCLKKLCLQSINIFIHKPIIINNFSNAVHPPYCIDNIGEFENNKMMNACRPISHKPMKRNIKSLFSCCVEAIQKENSCIEKYDNLDINKNNITFNKIKTLKCIAFEKVKQYLYNDLLGIDNEGKEIYKCSEILELMPDKADQLLALTIKSVNTLSDDIFAKLPDTIVNEPFCSEDDDSNFSYYDEYGSGYLESNQNDNLIEDSNWVSRVQLQELKSCIMPLDENSKPLVTKESMKECVLTTIKIEPFEEAVENIDFSIIKSEIAESDEIVFNPLATKLENIDNEVEDLIPNEVEDLIPNEVEDLIPEQTSSSYDVDAFEEFARTNKMLQTAIDYDLAHDEVFSQSALRVRKQHEPDMDDEFDTSMSLLIPQQNTELAKDRLMKSSSDEETNTQKNLTKKKRKIRLKISRLKIKELTTTKTKHGPETEVALLTRKMQERIRQEEKSDDSSNSDLEHSLAKSKHDKTKNQLGEKPKLKTNKEVDNQIQCNDVDSTENLNDKSNKENKNEVNHKTNSKMLHRKKNKAHNLINSGKLTEQDNLFVIQPDVPVELLECEPTLPIMQDDMESIEMENAYTDQKSTEPEIQEHEQSCIDRYGWKCYPVNHNDTKLYEHTYVLLEKLPESFVETYFRYQYIADKDQDDNDIDRLTNLQSLHRTFAKDSKVRSKLSKTLPIAQLKSKDAETGSRLSSPVNDDHYEELTPSDDEGVNIDDEIASAPAQDATENVMAKNSLMNDMDSDSEKHVNPETKGSINKEIKKEKDEEGGRKQYRPGPRSKKAIKENDSTFLTADKMMNKELALLHAPVELDAEDVKAKDTHKKPSPKNVHKPSTRLRAALERVKLQEESSSEEEKQWVTTKEKLLKRLKKGNPSVDDAKRAKLVSEFIEKRGDAQDKRPFNRNRKRRSRKRILERKKQMSVLNRELFGENDTSFAIKKHSQAFGKGRRNIRKVIDKKSLARSTVIANMEEFERKRRLNMQQTRLREQLGCEEGVNVLVINDEVCLEYDFEKMRPVVTIHPFFTKVMKAHQYEGVKFMWDACFESLAMVGSGHAGGGCILAHCMGLGKTLQVLALLHTVLTHPGVGMKRVLVCCPLSTVLNWVDEINKWIGPVTNQIKVFELSKLKKTYERAYQLEDWYKDGGIFIIGYELFRSLTTLDPVLDDIKPKIVDKIRHALLNPGPDVVICDEGHLLKNDASVLAVAMSRVATRRRIVLTGTPMQNNLREYYCMVNFVKPSLLGTYAEYSNRFENPIMNGQHRDSQEEDIKLMKARTHILHRVLEGCLQRQEASVLYPYLPKKHEYTVFIPPTKCQWDLYKHYMMTYAVEQQQQNKQHKQSVLKDFHVLQKIWTHPQVLHNFLMKARGERNKIKEEKLEDDLAQEDLAASEDVKPNQSEVWWLQYLAGGDMLESLESSNKFVVIFQLLDEFITLGDKVLIFSTSLYTMDALEYFLKRINKWSLGQEYFRLDGSVPPEVRQKWCREFNAPNNINTKLFLISTRAGCLGLNMTAANRVIILDTSWNPAHDIQSIFRVYRFGQKKDCFIYRLVAMGTMEQKIYERSVTKQAVSCRVVDEQQIDRHYNMSELTELYRFDEEGATVEAGLAAGVSDVALLRVAARARLHAVREHDSLLRGSREQHLPEHERNAAWMQFQQEHANNEMQDRLLEASQGIQCILEANYAMPSGTVPDNMETVEQPQPIINQPGSKGKKSKKKATNSTPPPEDPKINEQKNIQFDPEKEEAKVKKIMQLLIKHNFHTSKRAQEITQLVTSVRSIVDAGGAGLEVCDELTRSIATVMLQEEDVPIPPPPLTDIITGDIITSPSENDVKLEKPHEVPDETPDETPDEMPEEITDRIACQNNHLSEPDDSSLLVSTRRQRGRPRKYFADEIFEPVVKKARGRPRKNTTDTEQSLVDEEIDMPLILRNNRDTSASVGKKSRRLMGRPRRSYASDVDSSTHDYYSSKEQSSETDDYPVLVSVTNPNKNKSNTHATSEMDVTFIDDDTVSKDSGPSVVPDVREETIELDKPRRAIAVKSTAKVNRPTTNSNGKIKRKAAMVAEQHLESLDSDDIVTLDDDDDEWVNNSGKNYGRNQPTSKLTTSPQGMNTQKNDKNKTASNEMNSKKQKECSILLSDDEDPGKHATVSSSVVPTKSTDIEPEETVPLHPSMLSNQNFIKIVSYAYQSNRMLDEDAALLAARYSTQKALKEYESTGKNITSGPLYDIAVKVLTKDVLKKLYNRKGSKSATKKIDLTDSKRDTSTSDADPEVTVIGERNTLPSYESTSDYTSQANVVPVGMFRGSGVNQKSDEVVEECILPDDDDCILGTTNEVMTPNQIIHNKTNSQQVTITSGNAIKRGRSDSELTSAIESILPEIENPGMVSASQSESSKLTKSHPRVEPFVTITERPTFILTPQTPTYRLSKSNLKIEPTTLELERLRVTSGPSANSKSRPCLTLTISEGKLIQSNSSVLDLNSSNVVHNSSNLQLMSNIAQSSNDTICLDSDEEDVLPVNRVANIVHLPPPLVSIGAVHTSAPTPVAVTTSMPSFPVLSDSQGVPLTMRVSSAQTQPTATISAESQKKTSQNNQKNLYSNLYDNLKQQNNVTYSKKNTKASEPLLKFPKIMPKPNEDVKREARQTSNKVITPEDVLGGIQPEKQVKKTCKPGDIVRVTQKGSLAVLSRVDNLPDNLKSQLLTVSSTSEETRSHQSVVDKRKPIASSTSARSQSPRNDPLSILKDVIHIQADEYDEPASKIQNERDIKRLNPVETNKQAVSLKSESKETGGKITLQYTMKSRPDTSKATLGQKSFCDPIVLSKKKEFVPIKKKESMEKKPSSKTIDLTNIAMNNETVAVIRKSTDKQLPKGSVVVGSSKDIIIRTKPIGSTLTKASTSSANINSKTGTIKRESTIYANDIKKRTSSWPEPNTPKKKKGGVLRPTQTLEDFDIDDIDDIIELE